MTLTIIKVGARWRYESDVPHGTPHGVSHEIHVPDQIIPLAVKGEQRYRLQPHRMNLLDASLTAESLMYLASVKFCSQVYIVTTII